MTDETMRSPDQEPNLSLLFLRMAESLAKRWKFLVFGGMIFLGLAAVGIVMIPLKYEAKATILFSSSKQGSAGGALSLLKEAGLGNILGQDGVDLDQACSLLESESLGLWAIEKFRLDTMWTDSNEKEPPKKEVLVKLWKSSFRYHVTDFSAIEVGFNAASPKLAAQVIEGVCGWLDSMTLEIKHKETRENLRFIEEQLAIQTTAFDTAQAKLLAFQKRNRILALPEQVQASVEGSAKLESEALMADISAKSAATASGQESSEARRWSEYRDQLRTEAKRIISNPGSAGAFQGFDQGLGKLAEVSRLQREVLGRKTIYTFLYQQREQLLLESRKSLSSLFVLDKPYVPRKAKSPPRRAFFLLAAAFWGVGVSTWVIVRDALRRRSWTREEIQSFQVIERSIPLGSLLRKLFF